MEKNEKRFFFPLKIHDTLILRLTLSRKLFNMSSTVKGPVMTTILNY